MDVRVKLISFLTGLSEDWLSSAGAAHVADVGIAGQNHSRFIATAGSTLPTDIANATWTEAEGVHNLRFKVTNGTAGNRVRIVFDPSPVDDVSDTTQAAAWLAAAVASATLDVEYIEVAQGGGAGLPDEWSQWYQFAYPVRRVSAISVDADVAQNILIEAF